MPFPHHNSGPFTKYTLFLYKKNVLMPISYCQRKNIQMSAWFNMKLGIDSDPSQSQLNSNKIKTNTMFHSRYHYCSDKKASWKKCRKSSAEPHSFQFKINPDVSTLSFQKFRPSSFVNCFYEFIQVSYFQMLLITYSIMKYFVPRGLFLSCELRNLSSGDFHSNSHWQDAHLAQWEKMIWQLQRQFLMHFCQNHILLYLTQKISRISSLWFTQIWMLRYEMSFRHEYFSQLSKVVLVKFEPMILFFTVTHWSVLRCFVNVYCVQLFQPLFVFWQ